MFIFMAISFPLDASLVYQLILVRNLTPGGYIELADICFPVQADDESLPAESMLCKWSDLILEGNKRADVP
jgi:hypothetical protein